jgi:hypothetical protein
MASEAWPRSSCSSLSVTPLMTAQDAFRRTRRPGLGTIYDWFVDALNGSPYQDFALEIRARWRERVAARRWPKFTARAKPPH